MCKGDARESVCEGEEERRLKKGGSVYICCFSYIEVFGAVLVVLACLTMW